MAKSNEKEPAKQPEKAKNNKPDKKKQDKNKKPNFFVRMGKSLKETFSELKRVTWPTFGKAVKATGVVLGITLIFLILVTGVNYGFSELLKLITSWGA